ncbi:phosphatase PAP2 family protein [Nocardiopsis gilva YIM 90087]|uniref:Phosphatase PAP2 family protein n=1 Tax=Nocardiopsis gilva YIM 90087 TaxID=1235441 RepID=A0A223S2V1_9ACTN|nr:phosphatase PAP2 family protein [Nocardiopsis gilva]ASU82450.1 phosphatase PAP2 family protein [Nocardiopsis gilva YIM 90087]
MRAWLGAAWWRPHAVGTAVAAVLLFVITVQVIGYGPVTSFDAPAHAYFDPRQPQGVAHVLAVTAARLGQRGVTIPLLAIAAFWASLRWRDPRPVVATVTGLAALALLGTALKVYVGRTPPVLDVDIVNAGIGNITAWLTTTVTLGATPFEGFVSYPSGHTANAALTFPLLAWLLFGASGVRPAPLALRRALLGSLLPVVLVGTLMVVLDYHWVSEVLGGMALGAIVALISRLVLGPGRSTAAPEKRRPVARAAVRVPRESG